MLYVCDVLLILAMPSRISNCEGIVQTSWMTYVLMHRTIIPRQFNYDFRRRISDDPAQGNGRLLNCNSHTNRNDCLRSLRIISHVSTHAGQRKSFLDPLSRIYPYLCLTHNRHARTQTHKHTHKHTRKYI